MSRAQNASNDPLFFLLHSNVDRIYAEWQLTFPSLARAFSGQDQDGRNVTTRDELELGIFAQRLFPGGLVAVRDTFDMCVGAYAKSGVLNERGEWIPRDASAMEEGRDSAIARTGSRGSPPVA